VLVLKIHRTLPPIRGQGQTILESADEDEEKAAPKKLRIAAPVAVPVVHEEPCVRVPKRPREEAVHQQEDETRSDVSKTTKASGPTAAKVQRLKSKAAPILDLSDYPTHVSRPMILSEVKHISTDSLSYNIGSFDVLYFTTPP